MTVLFDTNVVLDVLLDREPHADAAAGLFARVENGKMTGLLGATTITMVYYLVSKGVGKRKARTALERLLKLFDVAPVTRLVLDDALARSKFKDFEDAVLHEAARHCGADAIVTRDADDFSSATLSIYSPTDLLRALDAAAEKDGSVSGNE